MATDTVALQMSEMGAVIRKGQAMLLLLKPCLVPRKLFFVTCIYTGTGKEKPDYLATVAKF